MKTCFVIALAVLLLALPVCAELKLETFSKDMSEKLIFSPGSEIIFKADSTDDVETINLIIIQGSKIVSTQRMQLLSESPKQFALLYKIPKNATEGDYRAKIISQGSSAETEFYVGTELKGQLMGKDDVEKLKESKTSLWNKFMIMMNALWVKIFG